MNILREISIWVLLGAVMRRWTQRRRGYRPADLVVLKKLPAPDGWVERKIMFITRVWRDERDDEWIRFHDGTEMCVPLFSARS